MKNLNLIIVGAAGALLTLAYTTHTESTQATDPHQPKRPVATRVLVEPNADPKSLQNPQVDFPGFLQLSDEVAKYRESRKVKLDEFLRMQKQVGTIVLDTRSQANYKRKHIAGAVHLNFSELTKADLARVVPSKDTRILIYCNNNFTNNSAFYAPKMPALALNIPTFVTLYGYGYKNVYELGESVSESDARIPFAGDMTSQKVLVTPDGASSGREIKLEDLRLLR